MWREDLQPAHRKPDVEPFADAGVGLGRNVPWVVLGQGGFDSGLGEIIETMPDGLKSPEPHELVIQVPPALKEGTYYLDRILTVAQLPYKEMLNNGEYLAHPYTEKHDMIDDKAVPVRTFNTTLGNRKFVPDYPIDPTTLTIHSEGYRDTSRRSRRHVFRW